MNEPTAFFQVGGTLSEDAPSYIERPADNELLAALERGELCLVLAPRQTGKSSLMVHAVACLRKKGVRAGIVDLQPLGTQRDPERWFSDAVYQIERTLRLKTDTKEWWKANNRLGPTQRFITFLEDVMLTEVGGNVVLFFDEIDSVLPLPFSDDFFTTIRSVYNARAHNSVLRRLTFVLLGVATASSFIRDRSRTPFNIGRSIALDDFDQKATRPFRQVLGPNSDQLIDRIFYWTNGHPLLVQRLAAAVYSWAPNERSTERINEEVRRTYFEGRIENDTHLKFIQDYLLADSADVRKTLRTYQDVLMREDVSENDQDPIQSRLKLSGAVKAKDGYLQVRNEIYRRVFDLDWVEKNIPTNWTRIVAYIAVIAVVVAVLAVGFILYNAWVGIRFQDCYANFYQTNAPEERVAHLAKMFRLRGLLESTDYDYRTRELFYGLSREEQLALFSADNVEDSDLIVVIKELYITLADTDDTDSTRPLLEAMVQALGDLNATEETKILEGEINSWLEGRRLAKQNQYTDALAEYNNAIVLNSENPATLYERARVLVELSEYQQALNDLDQVIAIARRAPAPTPTAPSTTTLTVSSTQTTEPTASPTLTPTSISTPGTDATPTETSSTASVTPTSASLPISTETPTPTNTPLPTYTPTPAAITSEFATTGEMISAVRNAIYGNPDLVSSLASASTSEYPNLREFGLVPPVISIIKPTQKVPCPLADECVFPIVGTSTNVVTSSQTIVIFVDPGGGNWWPQDLDFPLTIHSSGDWEGKAQIGDKPQPSGTEFHIIALLMNKTQVPITKQPYQELPLSITASGPIRLECDTCFYVNIISPQGAHNRPDAQSFPVSNNVEIAWEPSDCVMIVQYYQNDELKGGYWSVASGTEINIGDLGSGETEIKIWREGFEEQSDSIWVWVDSTLIPEPPPMDTLEPTPTNTPTVVPTTAAPVMAALTETLIASTPVPPTATPVPPTAMPTCPQWTFESGTAEGWVAARGPDWTDNYALGATVTSEVASEGQYSLRCDFDGTSVPTDQFYKAMFYIERQLDMAPCSTLVFAVHNSIDGMEVAISLSTGPNWVWHESPSIPLGMGWNEDITFNLDTTDFKTEADNWRSSVPVADKNDTKQLAIIFIPPRRPLAGSLYLDAIRVDMAGVPVVPVPPPTPTSTYMPTLTPTPTATPTFLPAPRLLDPENAGRFMGQVLLKWEWIRPLGEDEYFGVRIRPEMDPEACWHPQTKATQYSGDPLGCESGRHYWNIVVARKDPENPTGWREISAVSEERWFDFFR